MKTTQPDLRAWSNTFFRIMDSIPAGLQDYLQLRRSLVGLTLLGLVLDLGHLSNQGDNECEFAKRQLQRWEFESNQIIAEQARASAASFDSALLCGSEPSPICSGVKMLSDLMLDGNYDFERKKDTIENPFHSFVDKFSNCDGDEEVVSQRNLELIAAVLLAKPGDSDSLMKIAEALEPDQQRPLRLFD